MNGLLRREAQILLGMWFSVLLPVSSASDDTFSSRCGATTDTNKFVSKFLPVPKMAPLYSLHHSLFRLLHPDLRTHVRRALQPFQWSRLATSSSNESETLQTPLPRDIHMEIAWKNRSSSVAGETCRLYDIIIPKGINLTFLYYYV